MAKRPIKQQQAIAAPDNVPEVYFNLNTQDNFVASMAPEYIHYQAIPSPLGKKSKGDYRRPDVYDDESLGGFLYQCAGTFSGVMLSNSRSKSDIDGGNEDSAGSRMTMPRFYNAEVEGDTVGKRIYMAPGDKVYIKDPNVDVKVVNYQEFEYTPDRDNIMQFPVHSVMSLVDSRNTRYTCGEDFEVTADGNIKWLNPVRNPGIDPDTGKGRVCAIRYLYLGFWYVISIPNEIRIGRVLEGDGRVEARFPYQVQLIREYVYHQRKNSDNAKQKVETDGLPSKEVPEPVRPIVKGPTVKVQMTDVEEE